MKSFASSYNRNSNQTFKQTAAESPETTNNYETVEYCTGSRGMMAMARKEPPLYHQHGETANTEDVYYHENNEIYVEESVANGQAPQAQFNKGGAVLSTNSLSQQQQQQQQPQYLELVDSNMMMGAQPVEKFSFPLPPPPMSASNGDSHYLEATYPTANRANQSAVMHTYNGSAVHANTMSYRSDQRHQNQNAYSTNSLINVKYVIDLNDLKSHLNSNNNNAQAHTLSRDSLLTQQTMRTNISDYTHTGSVITEEPSKLKQQRKQERDGDLSDQDGEDNGSNPKKMVVKCRMFRCCFAFFNFILGFLSCCTSTISNCCCKPCCSTAGMLGGVGALGGLVAGGAALGVIGVIPIPVEFTRNICKMERERHFFNDTRFNNNFTNVGSGNPIINDYSRNITLLRYPNGTLINSFGGLGKYGNGTNGNVTNGIGDNDKKDQRKANARSEFELKAELKRIEGIKEKLKSLDRRKNKGHGQSIQPIQYDLVLYPKFSKTTIKKDSVRATGMEMKIHMVVSFISPSQANTTSLIQLSSRQFSTIELSFGNNSNNNNIKVKKWSYDSASRLLSIRSSADFKPGQTYQLEMVIEYKNYGGLLSDKRAENAADVDSKEEDGKSFRFLSFSSEYDSPFPVFVDSDLDNEYTSYSGPSVFNITMVKELAKQPNNAASNTNGNQAGTYMLICNMDVDKVSHTDTLELTTYKLSPLLPVQTISFILGDLTCRQNEEPTELLRSTTRLRVCTSSSVHQALTTADNYNLLAKYVRSLLAFYTSYTGTAYRLQKLDIVILPHESMLDFLHSDQVPAQLGIIYLPQVYIESIQAKDQLQQAQYLLKIIHLIAKQLAKHWFYNYQDCQSTVYSSNHGDTASDLVTETRTFMDKFCVNGTCGRGVNLFLRYNQNCHLLKGIVNWLAYLGFQSVYPDLFDLIRLEWALIRELDDTYFFSDSNVKYIYQIYDFPRLTDSDNILRIRAEMKSLLTARTVSYLLGQDKFQNFIVDWFKLLAKSDLNEISSTARRTQVSLLTLLEKYSHNYNMISARTARLGQVLNSWILAPDDVVLTINRNYNKKSAVVELEHVGNSTNAVGKVFYPLNWQQGDLITKDNMQVVMAQSKLRMVSDQQQFSIEWVNQSRLEVDKFPGGDKWIIGNAKKLFGSFRINYDEQNWQMLVQNLVLNHKSLAVNERVQIIDDIFYLANSQRVPITTALKVLEYIPYEDKYLPWRFLVDNVKRLVSSIEDDSLIYSNLRDYVIRLMKPTYHRLKWGESPFESMDDKLIRILVVDLLCSLDYEDCVENSVKQLVDSIKINVYNIPQHLSKSIYCTAIRYTGINEWLYLWKYYTQQDESSLMKDSLLYSLSCSSHIWILNLFLRKLVYENSIDKHSLPIVFKYISQNPVGKYIAWNHISQDYQSFYDKIGNDPELFLKILQVSTKELKFKYEVKQFYDFIEEIGTRNITFFDSKNNRDRLVSNIEGRINKYSAWKQSNADQLNEWLKVKNKRLIF